MMKQKMFVRRCAVIDTILALLAGSMLILLLCCSRPNIYNAAKDGDIQTVVELIDEGKNVDTEHCVYVDTGIVEGLTPLMGAARNGHQDILVLLLNNGASVNKQDSLGWTALLYATHYDHFDIVKTLIDCGADVNVSEYKTHQTPLFSAIRGSARLEIDERLRKFRKHSLYEPLEHPSYQRTFKLLLDSGAEVNTMAEDGVTPLYYCLIFRRFKEAGMIIDSGALIDARSYEWAKVADQSYYILHDVPRELVILADKIICGKKFPHHPAR